MAEKEKRQEAKNIKGILEEIHVEYLGDGSVKLTHGIDTCVRKIHKFPQHLRGEE